MKRVLLLPIMAMGLMVSQAWGQITESGADGNCLYNGKQIYCAIGGGCFSYTTKYSGVGTGDATCGPANTTTPKCTCTELFEGCQASGQAYTDVNPSAIGAPGYGAGVDCAANGGQPIAGGATKCGTCQYSGETTCNAIWSGGPYSKGDNCTEAMASCTEDGGTPGCTEGGSNPNPPPGGGSTTNCCWEANAYNDYSGYCGPVTAGGSATTEGTEAYCLANSGVIVSSCGGCQTTGQPNPIIISGRSVGLTVVPNGNILHIISERNATVELFSMTGAKVFSSKVAAGNSSLSLGKQKTGVYYAVVRSGSQKQTVKVILK